MAKGWRYSLTFRGHTNLVPEGQSVLGRSRQADVQISEPSVSRQHLRIVTVHDALVIEDLGASNGTYVNDAPIYGRTTVRHGDRLAVGDAELEVSITPINAQDTIQPAAGYGEATLFLQQQSVDLARQVEGGSQPPRETSPEEALEALGKDLQDDERPTLAHADVPTAITNPAVPTLPRDTAPRDTAPRDTAPRNGPADSQSAEEAGPFATMAVDRSLFGGLQSPPPVPAPRAATPSQPVSDPLPWQEEPTPTANVAVDAGVNLPAPHVAAGHADPPAPTPASTESTPVGSGWDAIAFDPVATPPPVAMPVASARPVGSPLPAAGFGLRAVAWLVDLAWIAALSGAFWLMLGLRSDPQGWQRAALLGLGCGALVIFVGWSLVGTTPGKRILGLFVCTQEGQPGIGFLHATIRGAVWVLSAFTLGIVFLMVLLPGGRTLHDRIAGTYVGRGKR